MTIRTILFEGFDKSGKSYFSRKFYQQLLKEKVPTIYVSEPYSLNTKFKLSSRDIIRNYIKKDDTLSIEVKNILYFLDREILYRKLQLLHKHEKFVNVVSDRSFISNVSIQSAFGVDTRENLLQKNITLLNKYDIPVDIVFYMNRDSEMTELERDDNNGKLTEQLVENKVAIKQNYDDLLLECELNDYKRFKDTVIHCIDNNTNEKDVLDHLTQCFHSPSSITYGYAPNE